jgi:hypothetical protein
MPPIIQKFRRGSWQQPFKIKIHNIQLKVTPYDGAITNAKDIYMKPNKITTKW